MSAPRPITDYERETISQAVDRAWLNYVEKNSDMRLRMAYPKGSGIQIFHAKPRPERAQLLMAIGLAPDYEGLYEFPDWVHTLFRIHTGRLSMDSDAVKTALDSARIREDAGFFSALSCVLAHQRISVQLVDALDRFLLLRWDQAWHPFAELFYYTSDELAQICSKELRTYVTPDQVKKRRQRLGLPSFLRKKLRPYSRKGTKTAYFSAAIRHFKAK